jgi:hypothetical protein
VPPVSTTAIGVVLGVLVGLRHAFEPDHLTAVSTLVSATHSPRHGALLGALWGLGHTISLVVVGVILALAGASLPARAGVVFELGVAVMLLLLGGRAVAIASRPPDRRAEVVVHRHPPGQRWRPLVVGLVHGLAGSGALTALVFAWLPGTGARILYVTLFGAGSILGMAIASGVAGAALQLAARSGPVRRRIELATGLISIAVGVCWGVPLVLQFRL